MRTSPFLVTEEAGPGPSRAPIAQPIMAEGEMAELIRHWNWERTALGALETWPEELLTIVNTLLSSPVSTAVYWGPQHVLLYNDAYRQFTGPRHPRSLGRPGAEVWAEAWHIVGPQIEAAYRTGKATQGTNALVPIEKNGVMEDCFWDYTLSPIHSGGRIVGVFNLSISVTEAMRAQQQLAESEARFRSVADTMPGTLYELEPDGKPRFVNQWYVKFTGRDAETLVREGWFDLLHPEDARRVREEFVQAMASQTPFDSEFRQRDREGSYRWVHSTTRANFDASGRLTHWTGAAIEITERKRGEALLRESEARFRTLFALAPMGVAISDVETEQMLETNEEMARITGYSQAEMATMRARDFTHPNDQGLNPELYRRVREAKGNSVLEKRYLRKDGTTIWVRVSLRLVHLPGQTGAHVVAAVQDITDWRRTQTALLQNEKLAVVGRLAASIAHEINNPLEAVTNLIYLAKAAEQLEAAREYLAAADVELARVGAIASQTLRFHRQSTKARAASWDDLIASVLAIYQGRIVNQAITVTRRDRATQAVVCLDGEIRQVLSNLVGNALDATVAGVDGRGGRLLLRSRNATDWKTGRAGVLFTIADTGSGMTPKTRQKLFEAFYTTKGNNGTGLGLWVSSEIVSRHQGTLRVRSRSRGLCHEGKSGTVFCLFLPHGGELLAETST